MIRLPEWFRDDLQRWDKFVHCFNGRAGIVADYNQGDPAFWTDSSMTGFGAWFENDWFAGVWRLSDHLMMDWVPGFNLELSPQELPHAVDINTLELWPVVCAIRRWGPYLKNRQVTCRSDNQQVIHMLNTGRSRNTMCMRWLRELFWLSFVFNVHIIPWYVRSGDNIGADILSRLSNPQVIPLFRDLFCGDSRGCIDTTLVSTSIDVDGSEHFQDAAEPMEEIF